MKYLELMVQLFIACILFSVVVGCSSAPAKRTKQNDPVMQVAIDADSIDQGSYARLQYALQSNGAWIVVDRGNGFRFADKEQMMENIHQDDRFSPRDRYAQLHKLYGIGGIVTATQSCTNKATWTNKYYYTCVLNLALINSVTGETIAVSEVTEDTQDQQTPPDWTASVDEMTSSVPKRMITNDDPNQFTERSEVLERYRDKISHQRKVHTEE